MGRLIIAVFFASVTVASCGLNKSDKDKEKIIASCDKIMRIFQEGKFQDAIQKLKEISIIDKSTIDTLTVTVKNQMRTLASTYGNINSCEYIDEKTIKDFLIKRTYLLRFDKYYLRFNFTIYKSNSGWTVTGFKYDDEMDDLFK